MFYERWPDADPGVCEEDLEQWFPQEADSVSLGLPGSAAHRPIEACQEAMRGIVNAGRMIGKSALLAELKAKQENSVGPKGPQFKP